MTSTRAKAKTRVSVDDLPGLIRTPDFPAFRVHFDACLQRPLSEAQRQRLRSAGADAFAALLDQAEQDMRLLVWFGRHYDAGNIDPTERLAARLARFRQGLSRKERHARLEALDYKGDVYCVKRVVQMSWFGLAGWEPTNLYQIKTSVFRSRQELAFCEALWHCFPHLLAFPNYPLDQVCDLKRLRTLVGEQIWRFGLHCRLDAVLVTREGDPIAAFELDSRLHDNPVQQERDGWRDRLLMLANIPLFRMRSEDPNATTRDEWYQLLVDEVVHLISVGDRLRNRDVHSMLVPA
jgi:hypothetical protein